VFSSFRLDSRIASDAALNTFFDTGGPVRFQPGFAAADKTDVMPLYLDVMTYATPDPSLDPPHVADRVSKSITACTNCSGSESMAW
jgi:hypothetical protein